jgi:hypothetical protein
MATMLCTEGSSRWAAGTQFVPLAPGLGAIQQAGKWEPVALTPENMEVLAQGEGAKIAERLAQAREYIRTLSTDMDGDTTELLASVTCLELPKWFCLHLWRNGIDRIVIFLRTPEEAAAFLKACDQGRTGHAVTPDVLTRLITATYSASRFNAARAAQPFGWIHHTIYVLEKDDGWPVLRHTQLTKVLPPP